MPLSRHARVALGSVSLITLIGVALPISSTTRQFRTVAASGVVAMRERIPEVAAVGARHKLPMTPVRLSTPRATAVAPRPAPPAPPTAGGLRLVVDHVAFSDHSAQHPGAPAMQALAGILVDPDTRQILWENNPHASLPPASTTKIVSSMVALSNFAPHRMITITPGALTQADDETKMGISAGEQYDVEDLLSGMLTVSANDAATAMAVDTVGMGNFVAAMNAQMQQLGLHDSHFTTPVGLDDPQQYSSPYDLAAVALEDMERYPVFRNIVWRSQVNLPQTATHPQFELPNLNRLLQFYPAAIGVKPGWTGNAGPCLVGMAERNGRHLIAVVMNDPVLYSDETALFQWGFAQYGIPPLPL
jgi:serine-type D-Ala-D-Ala carboxypeptidase (penicillin-binding protein 5/6)